jgi:hypothetical protein
MSLTPSTRFAGTSPKFDMKNCLPFEILASNLGEAGRGCEDTMRNYAIREVS